MKLGGHNDTSINRRSSGADTGKCCFCRKPTAYWYIEKDVAVCTTCAKFATVADIPDKVDWCNREAIASGSTVASQMLAHT